MSEIRLVSDTQATIREMLGRSDAELTPVVGGFTHTDKFLVTYPGGTQDFAKFVDASQHPVDATVLDHEAKIYAVLRKSGLTGSLFPEYRGYHTTGDNRLLVLQYLDHVTWGGPWTLCNLDLLDQALNIIHSLRLHDELGSKIAAIAANLHDLTINESETALTNEQQIQLFRKAWQPAEQTFINAVGTPYFRAPDPKFAEHILADAETYKQNAGDNLILRGANFGNVAFGGDHVYFVDPPYLTIGKPDHDRIQFGINILRQADTIFDKSVPGQARQRFITNREALAEEVRGLVANAQISAAVTQGVWGKFQQDCAVIGLREYSRLSGL